MFRRFSDHNGPSKKPEDEASEETQPEVELPLDVDHHRFEDAEQTRRMTRNIGHKTIKTETRTTAKTYD